MLHSPFPTDPRPAIRANARLTIGQAAEASGVTAKMIRYYESIGLLRRATRSAGNYRTYDEADLRALRFIARCRGLGFPLDEIARLLALWQEPRRSSAEVKALALRHAADLKARIAALQAMKATVEALAADCHGDARPDCPILDRLGGAAPHCPARDRTMPARRGSAS